MISVSPFQAGYVTTSSFKSGGAVVHVAVGTSGVAPLSVGMPSKVGYAPWRAAVFREGSGNTGRTVLRVVGLPVLEVLVMSTGPSTDASAPVGTEPTLVASVIGVDFESCVPMGDGLLEIGACLSNTEEVNCEGFPTSGFSVGVIRSPMTVDESGPEVSPADTSTAIADVTKPILAESELLACVFDNDSVPLWLKVPVLITIVELGGV